jgi:zinc protease
VRRRLLPIACSVAAAALIGAAPPVIHPVAASSPAFPASTVNTLPNGVIVATQVTADNPLVAMQVFLPAGLAQQPQGKAGIAAVTASIVLQTPVEGDASIKDIASRTGSEITFTVDPADTRFYIEAMPADMVRLVRGLSLALAHPSTDRFAKARTDEIEAADSAVKDPVMVTLSMIREVQYEGTGYASPDAGKPLELNALTPADVDAFAGQFRHGGGTVVALAGNVTSDVTGAVTAAFGSFASSAGPKAPAPPRVSRGHEIVAHRDVVAPWIAIGYSAPSQFSADFPAMLVIEALLGRGGGVHSFSFGPDAVPPDDYVGGYYQYEAQPGAFIEFYNGANVDQDLRALDNGVSRLRGGLLSDALLNEAKASARGTYLTSASTLDDQTWLLGRSAISPAGLSFENDLSDRIEAVSAKDVQRVARAYLTTQIVAVVLPNGVGD